MKWVLRYLRGTTKRCLCFGNEDPMLVRYKNVNMVGDVDFRKSTSGYLTTFTGELYLGNPSYKDVLLYQQLKQITLPYLKQAKR